MLTAHVDCEVLKAQEGKLIYGQNTLNKYSWHSQDRETICLSALFSNEIQATCIIKFQKQFHFHSAVRYFARKNSLNKTEMLEC